jgi:hypothetical protein
MHSIVPFCLKDALQKMALIVNFSVSKTPHSWIKWYNCGLDNTIWRYNDLSNRTILCIHTDNLLPYNCNKMEQYCAFILTIYPLDIRGRTSNRTEWYCDCRYECTVSVYSDCSSKKVNCRCKCTVSFCSVGSFTTYHTSNRTDRFSPFILTILFPCDTW